MYKKITLRQIPAQRLNVVLNSQNCTIKIYTKGEYCYCDLAVDGKDIRNGAICLVNTDLLAIPTPDFVGNLFFVDLKRKGATPNYAEFGTRFILVYTDEIG